MARIPPWSRTLRPPSGPNDQGHGFAGEPIDRDPPVSIDGPKEGAGVDPANGKPLVECKDRAVWRVRPNGMPTLRPTPSWSGFDRRMVRTIPSRTRSMSMKLIAASSETAEAARKSDQQQSPISQVLESIAHCPENDRSSWRRGLA